MSHAFSDIIILLGERVILRFFIKIIFNSY